MTRALLILPLAMCVAACPQLEKLKDPSKPTPAQQAMVDAGMFGVLTEVAVVPPCQVEFRIRRCGPEGELPW